MPFNFKDKDNCNEGSLSVLDAEPDNAEEFEPKDNKNKRQHRLL